MKKENLELEKILNYWPQIKVMNIVPIKSGLINQTFLLETITENYVLQKIHPVFSVKVNDNIEIVHLIFR